MILTNATVWASFKTDEGTQVIPVAAWDNEDRALIAHDTTRLVLAEEREGFEKLTTDGAKSHSNEAKRSTRRPSHFG